MVKLGVYTADTDEKEKELKKDELKKPPVDILTHVQIVPEGVVAESKKSCCTKRRLCLTLLLIFLIGAGIVAGVMAYRIFGDDDDHHKKEKFDCHVDYNDPIPDKQQGHRPAVPTPEEIVDEGEDIRPPVASTKLPDVKPTKPVTSRMTVPLTTEMTTGSVDEGIEVDEDEGTEKFEIPQVEECEQVTVMHDFSVGLSAYRLWNSERCFVKPLDSECMPPFLLAQLMRDPNYLRQHFELVRDSYLAVPPPIHDVSTLGSFIAARCYDVPTYWLEEATEEEDEPEPVVPVPFDNSEEESSSYEDWPWFRFPWSDSREDHRGDGRRHRRADLKEGNFLDKSKMEQTKIRYFDSDNKVKETKIYFK